MNAPDRTHITGLVLAGGRGMRMGGVDKGWVPHAGEPLVLAVVRRFAPQVGTLLVSANRNVEAYRALAEVVTDADSPLALEPFPGPLAGVLAGLTRASTEFVALAPCDAPDLPTDLVARLTAGIGAAAAAYPVADGRRQPVFALVRRNAAAALQDYLAGGGRAVHPWFETLGAVEVAFEDAAAFRNVNAPDDAASVAAGGA